MRAAWREVDGEWVLICPTCGYDYNHIVRVFTRRGADEAEAIVYEGTQAEGGMTAERRSALIVLFEGECGHHWEIRIQQHKGRNALQGHPRVGREF